MKSEVINQLTVEDIKDIYHAVRRVENDGLFYGMEDFVTDEREPVSFDSEPKKFCERILEYLKEDKDFHPLCKDRYPVLVEAAEYVTNHTLDSKSRKTEDVFIRCMVASQLHDENYGYSEIGRVMGISHVTVMYYVSKMNDMKSLPKMYETELKDYEAFKYNI